MAGGGSLQRLGEPASAARHAIRAKVGDRRVTRSKEAHRAHGVLWEWRTLNASNPAFKHTFRAIGAALGENRANQSAFAEGAAV